MGQGPNENASSRIISLAVNSTLSYVIGAKCKQLLKPNCCLDRSWGNRLEEALK